MHCVFRFEPVYFKIIRKDIMCMYILVALVGPSKLQICQLWNSIGMHVVHGIGLWVTEIPCNVLVRTVYTL
jgi:hypothetical protein